MRKLAKNKQTMRANAKRMTAVILHRNTALRSNKIFRETTNEPNKTNKQREFVYTVYLAVKE